MLRALKSLGLGLSEKPLYVRVGDSRLIVAILELCGVSSKSPVVPLVLQLLSEAAVKTLSLSEALARLTRLEAEHSGTSLKPLRAIVRAVASQTR